MRELPQAHHLTTYIQHADRFVRWLAGEIQI